MNRHTAAVLLVFLAVPVASLATEPMNIRHFRVNTASFADELQGQGDMIPVARLAAHAWAAYAGSSDDYVFDGTTTDNGCGAGVASNHVWATSQCPAGCPTTCNCLAAEYSGCAIAGYEVKFYKGIAGPTDLVWRLSPTAPPAAQWDVQQVLTHELGHNLLAVIWDFGHTDPPGSCGSVPAKCCVMNNGAGTFQHNQRYFCTEEIDKVRDRVAWHSDNPRLITTSQLNPLSNGWSSPSTLSNWSGLGFGDIARGTVAPSFERDSFFFTSASVNQPKLCDYRLSNCSATYPGPSINSHRRVTTAYDPVNKRWWLFTIDDSDQIQVSHSPDRVAWTNVGALHSGTAQPLTRVPVGAAYDPKTGSVNVLVNVISTSTFPPCPSTGCTGTIMLYTVGVNRFGNVVWGGPFKFGTGNSWGYAGFGSPAVACSSTGTYNCVGMVTGLDASRPIYSWGYATQGGFTYTAALNTGGTTLDPIALTKDGSAYFLAVVRGTDGLIYQNKKQEQQDAWSGWQALNNGSSIPTTTLGPVVRARSGASQTYDILYSP